MSTPPPPLTLHRTIDGGAVLRRGTTSSYRVLRAAAGESHLVRPELGGAAGLDAGAAALRGARTLLSLAHVTDLQLADVQSPARFEFFNREAADPRFAHLVPVQRPQEALAPRAVEAMVATLNRVPGGPVGGAPLQVVVTTGDAIDNAQWNELRMFLALLDGGLCARVRRRALPGRAVAGVAGRHLLAAGPVVRAGRRLPRGARLRRPPGAARAGARGLPGDGAEVPWLACFGNHEALIQGVGVVTPEVAAVMVGGRKPSRLPSAADRDTALELLHGGCDVFLGGDDVAVCADPDRRPMSRQEFVEAHLASGGRPAGHGFSERNARDGTCYYVARPARRPARRARHDVPGGRARTAAWTPTSSPGWSGSSPPSTRRYRAADGSVATTGHDDRLVVVFSHHGLDTLTNPRGSTDARRDLEALLHRFPNVVLWLTGHTHTNAVRARPSPDPDRAGGGFWEVTTCAVMDWPGQARLVELLDAGDGMLRIVCTMVDHDSPLVPHRNPRTTPAPGRPAPRAGGERPLRGAGLTAVGRRRTATSC